MICGSSGSVTSSPILMFSAICLALRSSAAGKLCCRLPPRLEIGTMLPREAQQGADGDSPAFRWRILLAACEVLPQRVLGVRVLRCSMHI